MTATQSAPTSPTTETPLLSSWSLDPSHSTIGFSVKHMMISTVRGRFASFNGTLTLDEANAADSTVNVSVDTTSVDTRAEQRDAHLRTSDFFDAANHPQITFVSRRVVGDVNGEFKLVGDFTIRGVTRELILDATFEGTGRDPWGGERRAFSARGRINRYDYGLMWNQGLEAGGLLVSPEVKLEIEAQFVKQA